MTNTDGPKTYRRRPEIVEAMGPVTQENMSEVATWIGGRAYATQIPGPRRGISPGVVIHTLNGAMKISEGDYICRTSDGTLFTSGPMLFDRSFEEVTDDE